MLRTTIWLLVGVCGFVSCIRCPDGGTCPDDKTCCKSLDGYKCCPYPNAMCCADMIHCCASGYQCNLVTSKCEKRNQPWLTIPMVKKEAAEKPTTSVIPVSPIQELKSDPDQTKASVVPCDNYNTCPDGTSCCRHPAGPWFCCPLPLAKCCLDGYHCCPYGYDCDLTYKHCVRQGLRYPFTPEKTLSSISASLISTPEDQDRLQETPLTALTEANDSAIETGVIR
ncbi:progranulin-like [Scomber japonicus]|uniref:progranulin-like n=1 Tax=Scomber japonicus TaxID=13676 RepID=UPI0023055011|nr:progranulin-like [Scomber japonicus]